MISPFMFCGMLGHLADQFIKDRNPIKTARCVSAEHYGNQLPTAAQYFFSVYIESRDLSAQNIDVVSILVDDTKNEYAKNTYTLVIIVDYDHLNRVMADLLFTVILSHEICHFVFYYELFIKLGGDSSSNVYNKFKNIVSITEDEINITRVDHHKVEDLIDLSNFIRILTKFPKSHFAKKNETDIKYDEFFSDFLRKFKIIG